jgi:hypothetical protein
VAEPDIKITLSTKHYSIYSILTTSNTFSTKAYFLLQKNGNKDQVDILITLKDHGDSARNREDAARRLLSDFKESLRENQIRFTLMNNNKTRRGQMLDHALNNPLFIDDKSENIELPESIAKILQEDTGDESYLDDPLQIAVPWDKKE